MMVLREVVLKPGDLIDLSGSRSYSLFELLDDGTRRYKDGVSDLSFLLVLAVVRSRDDGNEYVLVLDAVGGDSGWANAWFVKLGRRVT